MCLNTCAIQSTSICGSRSSEIIMCDSGVQKVRLFLVCAVVLGAYFRRSYLSSHRCSQKADFLNCPIKYYDLMLLKPNADKPCPILSRYALWVWHGSSEWIGHTSVSISCKKVVEIPPLILVVADIFCLLWKWNSSKIHFLPRLLTSAKA
jgi:hypothetical protein